MHHIGAWPRVKANNELGQTGTTNYRAVVEGKSRISVTVTGFFLFSGRRNSLTFDLRFREELSDLSRICVCVCA